MEKNNKTSTGLIKRIAIIGSESTGKTTLAEQLAEHFKTAWVSEYAREYVDQLKRKYTLQDIEIISKKQIELEDEKIKSARQFLFCDTNLIVSKIWAKHSFQKCPQWILDEIEHRHYDLYLLMDIDLPWVADKQREHPQLREYFLDKYKSELKQKRANYVIVSGSGPDRLKNAVSGINSAFIFL